MQYTKILLLFLSLIGIGHLRGADDISFMVMIGNDQYELPSGSGPFKEMRDEPHGIIAKTQCYAFLASALAYDAEKKRVEQIKKIPVVTQGQYIMLCNSEPSELMLYAIKNVAGGLFGLRVPAKVMRKTMNDMCSVALLYGYANFYLNKDYFDTMSCAK